VPVFKALLKMRLSISRFKVVIVSCLRLISVLKRNRKKVFVIILKASNYLAHMSKCCIWV